MVEFGTSACGESATLPPAEQLPSMVKRQLE
jgi:hypothetical protein